MFTKIKFSIYLTAISLTALNLHAGVYRFKTNNGDWKSEGNWQIQMPDGSWIDPSKQPVPGADDEILFCAEGITAILSSDAGTVKRLRIGMGDNKPNQSIILNPGAKLMVSGDHNCIGKFSTAALIVNGGAIYFGGNLNIADESEGTLLLNDGLVRVDDKFSHSFDNDGGIAKSVIRGGFLDVNEMVLNEGTMDIAGGIVRVRLATKKQIRNWISNGKITFYQKGGGIENIHYTIKPWNKTGFEIKAVTGVKSVG